MLWLAVISVQGCYAVAVPAAALLLVTPNALALFAFNAGARHDRPVTPRKFLAAAAGASRCRQFGLGAGGPHENVILFVFGAALPKTRCPWRWRCFPPRPARAASPWPTAICEEEIGWGWRSCADPCRRRAGGDRHGSVPALSRVSIPLAASVAALISVSGWPLPSSAKSVSRLGAIG